VDRQRAQIRVRNKIGGCQGAVGKHHCRPLTAGRLSKLVTLGDITHWKIKVLTQFILSRLPAGEQINYFLQILNGAHSDASISKRIRVIPERLGFLCKHRTVQDACVLEVGTGWEPLNPLLLYMLGAKEIHTYDHVRHMRLSLAKRCVAMLDGAIPTIAAAVSVEESFLRHRLEPLKSARTLAELLSRANIIYRAPADACQSGFADKSTDLFYSYAVLANVSRKVLEGLVKESARVLKPSGIAFHVIGCQDPYNGRGVSKVDFLQYPEWAWKLFVQNRISYNNRMREKEYLSIFRSYGAEIVAVRSEIDPSDVERVRHMKVDKQFSGMTAEELAVQASVVIYRFAT
jgi:SAM-dependent methyltransferase